MPFARDNSLGKGLREPSGELEMLNILIGVNIHIYKHLPRHTLKIYVNFTLVKSSKTKFKLIYIKE